MRVVVSWWDLADSGRTIDSLRDYLRDEAVPAWSAVEGLALKLWVADPATGRWGAIMVWEGDEGPRSPLPAHRATQLIGYGPTVRVEFEIEATVEGIPSAAVSAGIGAALTTVPMHVQTGHG
ncbi:MAG: hypothetical protein L0H22_12020, partial [Brevibacterium aurantiacum]|nr:hypothetical protein [Brevibacterium aurantiacum]